MMHNRSGLATKLARTLAAALALVGGAAVAQAQPVDPAAPDPAQPDPVVPEAGAQPVAEPEPEPEAEEAKPAAEVGYDKGFFIKQDTDKGSFALKINARVQSLLTVDNKDGVDNQSNINFRIRRARLSLEGHAFTEKLGYKFQTDFGQGFVTLKDFYIDGEVAAKTWIRAGQWKKPFSRQQINSSGRLELVDRSIVDGKFRNGRDIGVAIHNGYEKSPDLEWVVGVYNGQGDTPTFSGEADPMTGEVEGGFSNIPGKLLPVVIARVGLNRGGIKGYQEADLEGGPLRWAVAASIWAEGDYDDDDETSQQVEADFLVKTEGLSLSGSVNMLTANADPSVLGFHAQVGKVLGEDTRRLQPVARYSTLIGIGDNEDAMQHEILVGFGWYPYGHDLKLQADIGSRLTEGGAIGDRIIGRLQLTSAF